MLSFQKFVLTLLLLLTACAVFAAPHHHSSRSSHSSSHSSRAHRTSTATYFSRGDSNPHLANGDTYGSSGPWFCAVDSSRRNLLGHHIHVTNTRTGRSHVFLVADLGRFSRGNIDVSRGGSSRLSGYGRPENFPVAWHDLGPAPQKSGKQHRRRR